MKNKTMLKFLLCFLIIGSCFGVFKTEANTQNYYCSCLSKITILPNGGAWCEASGSYAYWTGTTYVHGGVGWCANCGNIVAGTNGNYKCYATQKPVANYNGDIYYHKANGMGWCDTHKKLEWTINCSDAIITALDMGEKCICGGQKIYVPKMNKTYCSNYSAEISGDMCSAIAVCNSTCEGYVVKAALKCRSGHNVLEYKNGYYHVSDEYVICMIGGHGLEKKENNVCFTSAKTKAAALVGSCRCGGAVYGGSNGDAYCGNSKTKVQVDAKGRYLCGAVLNCTCDGYIVIEDLECIKDSQKTPVVKADDNQYYHVLGDCVCGGKVYTSKSNSIVCSTSGLKVTKQGNKYKCENTLECTCENYIIIDAKFCKSGNYVEKYDNKYYHLSKTKVICSDCNLVDAPHDFCSKGGVSYKAILVGKCKCNGDIYVAPATRIAYCSNSNMQVQKKGDGYECSAMKCSEPLCNGYIRDAYSNCSSGNKVVPYNGKYYHETNKYICSECKKIVESEHYHKDKTKMAVHTAICNCGGKVYSYGNLHICEKTKVKVTKNAEDGTYDCLKDHECNGLRGEVEFRNVGNGYHDMVARCSICGEKNAIRTEKCNIGAITDYVYAGKNEAGKNIHALRGKCAQCGVVGTKNTAECNSTKPPVGYFFKDGDYHFIRYRCDACGYWYEELGNHEFNQKKYDVEYGPCAKCEYIKVNTKISGGVTDSHFLTAGFNLFKNQGAGAVDDNIGPIKHIMGLIMMIGSVAGTIVIGIYAIQWMTATPAKRQELKSGAWPLVIGIALLSLGPTLAVIIVRTLLGV